jgi:selenoprotein W-related protein
LTTDILGARELEVFISSWRLVPSSGGVFEVTVNGELVFSKKALGRHAEPGEVRAAVERVLEAVRPPGVVYVPDDED